MTRALRCTGMLASLVVPWAMGCQSTDSRTTKPEPAADLAPTAEAEPAADRIVPKVVDAPQSTSFSARATLTRTETGSGVKHVRQLLIKGHRDAGQSTMLYQQVWPGESPGPTLVVEDAGDHPPQGFLHQSGRAVQLTVPMLADQVFDSDLTIEDLTQSFWDWPSREIVGEEAIGEYRCAIVEFRPGPNTPTEYSLVKVWLSSELAVALRVEQFGQDGELIKRIGLYRILKLNDRWLPAIVTVEPADGQSRTVLEGVGFESDLHLTANDFGIDAIAGAVRAPQP